MDYKLHKYDSGLRVITVPMPSAESATVTIWVKTGSRNESKKINGVSHFLEHMVFKGSKKRPSAKEIAEAVDSFGGEFNASTSKEWTNFYIRSRTASIDKAFDILSDMVLNPILDADEIEREKGVIKSEIAMYEDSPMSKIGDLFENLIFKGSSLGRDIIGTKESVSGLTRDDFVRYRKKYYFPKNILVTVSGGVEEKKVLELVKKYLKEFDSNNKKIDVPKESFNQSKPNLLLEHKDTDQAHLMVGFRGFERGHKTRFHESVLSSILGGGMSSRMFTEVRERRGLAYAVKTSPDHYQDVGYFATYAGVRLDKIEEAIKVILEQMQKIKTDHKITKKEFKKAKEYMKGRMALSLENTKSINSYWAIRELFLGLEETPEEVYKKIDEVTIDEVVEVAEKLFNNKTLNLAIIGPYKDKQKFQKLIS